MRWDEKSETPQMFNRIAKQYDRMNAVLSFGLHHSWRKRLARTLPSASDTLLDLACGTGDQLMSNRRFSDARKMIGLDPSAGMLAIAKEKLAQSFSENTYELILGIAEELPFKDGEINAISMSFGIRNVTDVHKSLTEMYRVLAPSGTVSIMEFSLSPFFLYRYASLLYLTWIVPFLGRVFAKDVDAYGYLAESIKQFPSGSDFCALLLKAGFRECRAKRMFFGNVTLYTAIK